MAAPSTEDEATEGAVENLTVSTNTSGFEASDAQPQSHCYFLDLPTELRLYIYELLFSSLHKPFNDSDYVYHLLDNPYYRSEAASATAILYANKKIIFEAWPALNQHSNDLISFMLKIVNCADKELMDDKHYDEEVGSFVDDYLCDWNGTIYENWKLCKRRCSVAKAWVKRLGAQFSRR